MMINWIKPLPTLVCMDEGDSWYMITPLLKDLRMVSGRVIKIYKLEMFAFYLDGIRLFKFPVYIPKHMNALYYSKGVEKHFMNRLNPMLLK